MKRVGYDEILLPEMVFHTCHGVYEKEKTVSQTFRVALTMALNTEEAGQNDDLQCTVDYSKIYQKVANIMLGPAKNLLEHLAADIAATILADAAIARVCVEVCKEAADMGDGRRIPAIVRINRERA